jgi:hypothetical protein
MDLTLLQLRPFVPEFRIDALQVMGTLSDGNEGGSSGAGARSPRHLVIALSILITLFGAI